MALSIIFLDEKVNEQISSNMESYVRPSVAPSGSNWYRSRQGLEWENDKWLWPLAPTHSQCLAPINLWQPFHKCLKFLFLSPTWVYKAINVMSPTTYIWHWFYSSNVRPQVFCHLHGFRGGLRLRWRCGGRRGLPGRRRRDWPGRPRLAARGKSIEKYFSLHDYITLYRWSGGPAHTERPEKFLPLYNILHCTII